jgi:tetratricopeptide (TPR) repeat protein
LRRPGPWARGKLPCYGAPFVDPEIKEGVKFLIEKRYQRAAEAFQGAADQSPSSRDAWHGLAAARLGLGDLAGSEAALKRILDLYPADAGVQAQLAHCRFSQGDPSALKTLRTLAKLPGAGFQEWHSLAVALEEKGQWGAAFDAFVKATKLSPGDAMSHFGAGALAVDKLDDWKAAVIHLGRAAELVPEDYKAPMLMSRALLKLHRPAEARKLLEGLMERHPDVAEVVGEFVCLLHWGGQANSNDNDVLYRCAARWRELDPANALAAFTAGAIHMDHIGFEEARRAFAAASALEPSNPRYLRSWMEACFLGGHLDEGEEVARKLETLSPDAKARAQIRQSIEEAKNARAAMARSWGPDFDAPKPS